MMDGFAEAQRQLDQQEPDDEHDEIVEPDNSDELYERYRDEGLR